MPNQTLTQNPLEVPQLAGRWQFYCFVKGHPNEGEIVPHVEIDAEGNAMGEHVVLAVQGTIDEVVEKSYALYGSPQSNPWLDKCCRAVLEYIDGIS